jgi:NitT/TauT family transport system ATP-binding protein
VDLTAYGAGRAPDPEDATMSMERPEKIDGEDIAITIRGLDVSYRTSAGKMVHAVKDFSLDVRRGEFLTLIGPSGCGKTSVLQCIGGLQTASSGTVKLDGELITGPRPDRVAYVFQDFALMPWRTALANVELALEIQGNIPKSDRRERARAALEDVGLLDAADRHPSELSGGMKQRVAIARALAVDADVLLLDEPFGALDEHTRMVLGVALIQILESLDKTIVFVTHGLQEAVYLSDRVVAMSAHPGTVQEILPVPLDRPRQPSDMTSHSFIEVQARLLKLLLPTSADR